jgi:hypothetical protein
VFFQTLEPFLVDDTPDHRHRGRIARATLEPMWLWISNTLMPEDTRTYSEQVEQGLLAAIPTGGTFGACIPGSRRPPHPAVCWTVSRTSGSAAD